MFNLIYQWKIRAGKEAQFEAAWAEITLLIRSLHGGEGSRLHRTEDGSFLAYAQWPNEETWKQFSASSPVNQTILDKMKDAILSSEAPIKMTMIQDLFIKL
jgi:heme-degrading monooxygenase HmoA